MPFNQYHEPPEELSDEMRTRARVWVSLIEEAEAIDWYGQRASVEKDEQARKNMTESMHEEFKHFLMHLEWLFRHEPTLKKLAQGILFKEGDIAELAEQAEDEHLH